ncbi:hypothetical protein ACIBQX_38810 [Nonomuraea sp. NPDC049714]|uniref:hypothetical protein n=1 Tax=Nonomuraea sp. NPDC049714 TaxID=3364357 RepID=UPI00379160F0
MARFHSGFTCWIEQRLLREDPDDLTEAIGALARTEGLSPQVADHVAAMSGTTSKDVVTTCQGDDTECAGAPETFDRPDLT